MREEITAQQEVMAMANYQGGRHGRRYPREFGRGETQNVGQFGGSLRPGQNSPWSYQIILQEDEEPWINLENGFSE